MNTDDGRRRRAGMARAALIAAALIAIVLTATACGGSSASPAAKDPDGNALAFAQCMRAHGVPAFPDPGQPAGNNIDENSPSFLRATTLCDQLTHNPPGHNSPAHEQQMLKRRPEARRVHSRARGARLPGPHDHAGRQPFLRCPRRRPPLAAAAGGPEDLPGEVIAPQVRPAPAMAR
jgi:hypothetical protein